MTLTPSLIARSPHVYNTASKTNRETLGKPHRTEPGYPKNTWVTAKKPTEGA
jgi:hypothetical protein